MEKNLGVVRKLPLAHPQESGGFVRRVSQKTERTLEGEAARKGAIPGAEIALLDGTVGIVESVSGGNLLVRNARTGKLKKFGIGAVQSVITPAADSSIT